MDAKHIALAALAASLLLAGAAGAATAQAGPNADDANETAAPADPGPPEDAPGERPDFVSSIHDTISDFLSGSVDHLGSAISDLTPGEDGADGDAGNGTADERPDPADERADG